jgi:hypothetical protein
VDNSEGGESLPLPPPRRRGGGSAEAVRELCVELDGYDASGGLKEALREGAESGTDLDDGVARCKRSSGDYAVEDAGIGEEVLAKRFRGRYPGLADGTRTKWTSPGARALATARG